MKKQVGCQLSFEISVIEIYCNKLRDLFSIDSSKIVDVKTDPRTKKFFVENATWVPLDHVSEFLALIERSAEKRVSG